MASSLPADNDLLHQLPGLPIRAGRPVATELDPSPHIIDHNNTTSSPLTTPTPPPAHQGSSPADAAMGDIS